MGKLIVEQVVTADGFGATKDGSTAWFEQDETLDETVPDQLAFLNSVDAIVLGANTYKMFVQYWPTANTGKEPDEVTRFINTKPKHVFSKSLEAAPWGDHTPAIVERGDLATTVTALRARYPGNLILWGSLQLAAAMLRAKLVDQLRLRSVPLLIGEGKPIAPAGTLGLELESSKAYPKGHIVTQYRLR